MFVYEALELLSIIKLGVEMDLLNVKEFSILEAGVAVSPCHVRRFLDSDVEEEDVDRERAAQLRRVLDL
jgi:protein-arginine kinase